MLANQKNYCPYCGEIIELIVDTSLLQQEYIEDCSVCCRPMVVNIVSDIDNDGYDVQLKAENE